MDLHVNEHPWADARLEATLSLGCRRLDFSAADGGVSDGDSEAYCSTLPAGTVNASAAELKGRQCHNTSKRKNDSSEVVPYSS